MASFTFGYGGAYAYRGSLALAQILYQTQLGDFTYNTDASGNIVLTNQGSDGTSYDGLPYSGRGIELGALNDVDIPIHYTLGVDGSSHTMAINAVEIATSDNLDGSYSVIGTSTNVNSYMEIIDTSIATSEFVLVEFTVVINSGSAIIDRYFDGVNTVTLDTPHTVVNGTNKIEVKNRPSRGAFLYFPTGTTIDMDVTPVSIKQITNPNSYITLYDFTNGFEYIDCSTLTPSTTYNIVSKTVNNILTHTTAWNATDKAKIENNPNLVGKLAIETLGATKTIPELDMVMDAGASADSYYMCSEKSGAYIVDSRGIGSNLVPNSTFDTATTGWSVTAGNGTIASAGGELEVTCGSTGIIASTPISTIIGNTYLISAKGRRGTTTLSIQFGWSTTSTGTPTGVTFSTTSNETKLVYFTATSTTTYINIRFPSIQDTTTAYFDDIISYGATATEIANYASTVRTNADLQQKGIQTTAFVTDGAGTPLSYTSNILNWDGNGYCNHQWNPSLESAFWLEEIVDGVVYQHKYDGINLTTYTDNVAGTPTAHSPENANYLSGKGVYPKVTADPYTVYQCKYFSIHNGSRYANYNQSSRYTFLAAM